MCGIIGYVSSEKPIDPDVFDQMRDSMAHRGPDGKKSVFFKENHIAFGHRRLSIIDLSERSDQPLCNEDKSVWIVFNGEIYNYKELKSELSDKHRFISEGDTEVLVHGYEEWGIEKLLGKLNGMFSFSILDLNLNKTFLVRDRVGIKPLHYFFRNRTLIFSSELKGIHAYPEFNPAINGSAIASYFSFRYVISPLSMYQDCHKLEPGHFIEYIHGESSFKKSCYWNLEDQINTHHSNEKDAVEKIQELIYSSVKMRTLAADVPVHTFLSGGIDSSIITAHVNNVSEHLTAYSIEVDNIHKNEVQDAEYVAKQLNINLTHSRLDQDKFNLINNDVINAYDEPLADTSNIPTYFLCELTAQNVKVALSGDGGDELFYGYSWYEKFNRLSEDEQTFSNYLELAYNTLSQGQIAQLFPDLKFESVNNLLLSHWNKNEKTDSSNVHRFDFHTFLVDDILTKVDIASMAHSLEVRVPFLDHRLVEYAYSLPFELLYKNNELKYLLKKSAIPLLPTKTIYKKKQGFSIPSVSWLDVNYEHNIINGYASRDGFWNKKAVASLLQTKLHEEQKWLLYNFERWYAMKIHGVNRPLNYSLYHKILNKMSGWNL